MGWWDSSKLDFLIIKIKLLQMTEVQQAPIENETNLEDVAKAYMEVRQRKDGPSAAPLDAKIAAMLPKVSIYL